MLRVDPRPHDGRIAVPASRAHRVALGAVVVVLVVAGGALAVAGLAPPEPAPSPSDAVPTAPPVPSRASGEPVMSLPRANPVEVGIAAIDVRARVVPVGLARDGTIAAPELEQPKLAGWFDAGPTPGEVGAAALVGHVDSRAEGAAVFYRLRDLRSGDRVEVSRDDGSTAEFTVDLVESYPKDRFPYRAVFTGTGFAALRLITCGGAFDQKRREYRDNVVVYATLDDATR